MAAAGVEGSSASGPNGLNGDLRAVGEAAAAGVREEGFAVVRGALSPDVVANFVEQIEAELQLADGTVADSERTVAALSLSDPTTWPSGGRRRVVECAPLGTGAHWAALTASPRLAAALDAVLGEGTWEVPTNTRDSDVRFFYAPVVFPEDPSEAVTAAAAAAGAAVAEQRGDAAAAAAAVGSGDDGAGDGGGGDGGEGPALPLRDAELMSWKEERKLFGQGPTQRVPPSRWQPVNRRRFRGKGWHVDIGPGFGGGWKRTLSGHPFQGVVMLLVLSDWEVGGGGTCMVSGSHLWVRERIAAAGDNGLTQDELNEWCVERTVGLVRGRALRLIDTQSAAAAAAAAAATEGAAGGEGAACGGGETSASSSPSPPTAVQVVATRGDVVLMHPLIVHGGTTNHRPQPRIMANGMARVKREVFERDGHPLFPKAPAGAAAAAPPPSS